MNLKFGDAIYINELQKNKENEQFLNLHFITLEKYFEKYKEIFLNEEQLKKFLNGVKININNNDGIYKIRCRDKIIGTGIIEKNCLKRDIIL